MASTSSSSSVTDQNDQSTKIKEFCSITGSTTEKAQKMLEVCNWNLEMAVNMHVDSDYQDIPQAPKDSANCAEEDTVRAPIPPSRAILVEEDLSLQYRLRSRKRTGHSVFDGFRDFQAEAELHSQSAETEHASKKRRTLEDLFRPPLGIMHRGTFESAREIGVKDNMWLMVNLQDSQEFSCQVLNRDVWSNETIKKMIQKNFVFWQVYSDSTAGERYMQFYNPVEFPYIAILDPITGEKLKVWNTVTTAEACRIEMTSFLRSHGTPNGTSRSDDDENCTLMDQTEEEQLQAAIKASMQTSSNSNGKNNSAHSSTKTKNHIDVEEDDSDLETFESDSETEDKNISELSNDTIDVVSVPEIEPSKVETPSKKEHWKDFLGSDNEPKSELVIRLPNGSREQVSWPSTTRLKSLLLYVEEVGFDSEKYELVTNFPRRNLCQLDQTKTLKDVDLFPREMIFVQLKT